jgi:hypothetical protein
VKRFVLIIVVLLVVGPVALGQRAPRSADPEVHQFSARPAAAAAPALRYHFLPELVDQEPGNAVVLYMAAARELANVRGKDAQAIDEDNKVDRWLGLAVRELPKEEVRAYLAKYVVALTQYRLATLRERCEFDPPFRTEGFKTFLPYLHEVRPLARLAVLSGRLKIADGDYAGAVEDLGIPLAHARHLNGEAMLVQLLVAASVAQMSVGQVPEVVQQEYSPNLYWALSALPAPMLDVRRCMQFERAGAYFSIPQLKEARAGRLTAEQWSAALQTITAMRGLAGPSGVAAGAPGAAEQSAIAVLAVKEYPIAKRWLLEERYGAAEVEAMPVPQALGLYHVGQFERWTQELDKGLCLPYWQGFPMLTRAEEEVRAAAKQNPWSLLAIFTPTIHTAYATIAKVDRQVAIWRAVEAVRAYAAAHDGRPPATLEEITDTPAPLDPFTGKAFIYGVKDDVVTIEGPTLADAAPARTGIRVVMTLMK